MNVYKPMIVFNLIQSIRLLSDASTLAQYCIAGIEPNARQIEHSLQNSLMLVATYTRDWLYKASQLAKYAHEHDCSLIEATRLKIYARGCNKAGLDPKRMLRD